MGFWGSSMLWLCCYQMGPLTPTKSHCMHLALVEDVASVYKMFAPWFLFNEALVLQFICRTIASFSRLYCSDCPDISDGFHAHQRHGLHEHARFEHMNCLNHGISLLQKLVGRKCRDQDTWIIVYSLARLRPLGRKAATSNAMCGPNTHCAAAVCNPEYHNETSHRRTFAQSATII